jgi:hypothetical protein
MDPQAVGTPTSRELRGQPPRAAGCSCSAPRPGRPRPCSTRVRRPAQPRRVLRRRRHRRRRRPLRVLRLPGGWGAGGSGKPRASHDDDVLHPGKRLRALPVVRGAVPGCAGVHSAAQTTPLAWQSSMGDAGGSIPSDGTTAGATSIAARGESRDRSVAAPGNCPTAARPGTRRRPCAHHRDEADHPRTQTNWSTA